MGLLRKLAKVRQSLSHPLTRAALCHKVAASYEHAELLCGLGNLSTVVDVGANVGQFALLCRLVHPQAKVHSFEPMAEACVVFDRVLGGESNVRLHRCALGAEAGEAEIYVTARADSSSLLRPEAQMEVFPGTHEVGTRKIRVALLGDEVPEATIESPALLKIDVQGFEGQVLRGCEALLDRFDWIRVHDSRQNDLPVWS